MATSRLALLALLPALAAAAQRTVVTGYTHPRVRFKEIPGAAPRERMLRLKWASGEP